MKIYIINTLRIINWFIYYSENCMFHVNFSRKGITLATIVHAGSRWQLSYGTYQGVERFAIAELQRCLQSYLPYLLPITAAKELNTRGHLALLGTADNNPYIAELIATGTLVAPAGDECYSILSCPSPWDNSAHLLVIAGSDPAGVLYGVEEFNARHMYRSTRLEGKELRRKYLDEMKDFAICEAPAIANRGIWSWGYVIYDYRRFIDNMARLKMNMLTIWNDCAPLNMSEVIEFAHSRAVKVIAGFHWGWGLDEQLNLTKKADRDWIKEHVLQTYRREYADTAIDGIYFQTLTEHATQELAGKSIASWVCELTNDISVALLAEFPLLTIQFGLHATSIRDHFRDLAALDPRITIIWEDAGAIPFGYIAEALNGDITAEKTLNYARELATFRPGTTFGMVPKGWMCLRWGIDFENHGNFILGERDAHDISERLLQRQGEISELEQAWLLNYPLAAHFYREILAVNPQMLVTGLIEDGLFEEKIQSGVALFAAMLWNPNQSDQQLLARALQPYYQR